MIKFRTISQIEHCEYPFEDAVIDEDVMNGAFGDVTDGKFTANEISAGSHVRVLDPMKVNGEFEVYGYPLPKTFAVGDTIGCFTITEIIGNKIGAVVRVTA